MTLFVDTSVWSLAFRRDSDGDTAPEVRRLDDALTSRELVTSTGLVLQELLQGFTRPTSAALIVERFAAIPLITPDRLDHIQAAKLRNRCRTRGVQAATIDCLLAQLCIANDLVMLSTDQDFQHVATLSELRLWRPG
jgi:predicted nucleic acid-binding protein